jgi:transcriptional regulator with XRE-family HTH domain
LRTAFPLSLTDLAEVSGLTASAIYYPDAGKRQPSWPTVCQLADALEVSTEAFRDHGKRPTTRSKQ